MEAKQPSIFFPVFFDDQIIKNKNAMKKPVKRRNFVLELHNNKNLILIIIP